MNKTLREFFECAIRGKSVGISGAGLNAERGESAISAGARVAENDEFIFCPYACCRKLEKSTDRSCMDESEAWPQSATAEQAERRGSGRVRTYKSGKIISVNLSLSFDCLVRDLTAEGAKLIIGDTAGVPTEFFFLLPTDRLIAKARVIWRKRGQIGIQFMEPLIHAQKHSHPGLRLVALC